MGGIVSKRNQRNSEPRKFASKEGNSAAGNRTHFQCVYEFVQFHAKSTPNKIAVFCEDKTYTYGDLNRHANQIANFLRIQLRSKKMPKELLIATFLQPSYQRIAVMLGILKLGGAYVSLSTSYPPERLQEILELAPCVFVIAQEPYISEKLSRIPFVHTLKGPQQPKDDFTLVIDSNSLWNNITKVDNSSGEDYLINPNPESLFTVIFTSGTTGKPKGARLLHKGLVRFVDQQPLGTKAIERWCVCNHIMFDASIYEIWIPLMGGGELVVYPDSQVSFEDLTKLIESKSVTNILTTTAMLNHIMDHDVYRSRCKSMRAWLFGGEHVSVAHIVKALDNLPDCSMIHAYGPAECSVLVTTAVLSIDLPSREAIKRGDPTVNVVVPVGTATPHSAIYIVDNNLTLIKEPGVTGEIWIGGIAVGGGYHNNLEATNAKFVRNPFVTPKSPLDSGLVYKTGDLGKWSDKGQLVFVGRNDNQIKLGGYRVELEEIQAIIDQHPQVKETVVVAYSHQPNEGPSRSDLKYLCAYVVPNAENSSLSGTQIKQYLSKRLPHYMVPSYFVIMEGSIPLNLNGKVDRKNLPMPTEKNLVMDSTKTFEELRTATQKTLANLWKESLNLSEKTTLGLQDSFFELGGQSLALNRLGIRIQEVFGVSVPFGKLYSNVTSLGAASAIVQQLIDNKPTAGTQPSAFSNLPKQPRNPEGKYSLSAGQRRLWSLFQMNPQNTSYNIPVVYEIHGKLDKHALQKAFCYLVARHEILRTIITESNDNSEPVQQVLPPPTYFPITVITESMESAQKILQSEAKQPLDISRGPLVRATLVSSSDTEHRLLLLFHHAVIDGYSLNTLNLQMEELYKLGTSKPETESLIDDRFQYKDFAYWEQSAVARDLFNLQLEYWKRQLCHPIPVLDIPTDYPLKVTPDGQSIRGARFALQYKRETYENLRFLASSTGNSMFIILFASWTLLLYKYTHQDDIMVGTFSANRKHSELQNSIGFFLNTIVLRTKLSWQSNDLLSDILKRIQETTSDALQNSDVPFDKIVDVVKPERNVLGQNAFFRSAMVFQNWECTETQTPTPGVTFRMESPDYLYTEAPKFDIMLELYHNNISSKSKGELWGWIEYRTDLWERNTIASMATHFHNLIDRLPQLIQQNKRLSDVDIMSPEEKLQVTSKIPAAISPTNAGDFVHRRFEAAAERWASNIAVKFEKQSITYKELNERSNQLARYLRETHGVKAGQLIVVHMPRSLELLIAILGVIKSGAAYVPIDPIYPVARIVYIIGTTESRLMISKSSLHQNLINNPQSQQTMSNVNAVLLDDAQTQGVIAQHSPKNIQEDVCSSEDLVYIIFTSGSTGNPKGVMITHHNVVRLLEQLNTTWFHWNENDTWTLFHSYAFDVSVNEMWGALFFGGKLIVLSTECAQNTYEFYKLVESEKVTVLCQTPSAFMVFIEVEESIALPGPTLPQLRYVMLAGERLHFPAVRPFIQRHGDKKTKVINLYGITETTVHCTYFHVDEEALKTEIDSNIGVPIPDLRLLLLDPFQNPVPVGVPGEIYVGGEGVAKGYFKNEDTTSKKYIQLPQYGSGTFFRSGDTARLLPNGTMTYIGRIDHQVKVRGFRVDLSEITAAIMKTNMVIKAHATSTSLSANNVMLVAFIVAPELDASKGSAKGVMVFDKRTLQRPRTADSMKAKVQPSENNLATLLLRLENLIPYYMMPAVAILVDDFQLNHNGKLDMHSLPNVRELMLRNGSSLTNLPNGNQKQDSITTQIQRELLDLWKQVLNNNRITAYQNFFNVGGNSLLATTTMLKTKKQFKVDIPISIIYTYPTIVELAQEIERLKRHPVKGDMVNYPLLDLDEETKMEPVTIPEQEGGQDILLTGATGFVGCFLLEELLKRTTDSKITVYCLIQSTSKEHARERLESVMKLYEIDIGKIPGYPFRIEPVSGDISLPRFGLDEEEYNLLAANVGSIYNSAAKVNFIEPYPICKPTNVEGVKNLIRFACHLRKKHIHQVSSLVVFGPLRKLSGIESVDEKTDLSLSHNNLFMGYADSKLVSEKILWKAHSCGVPVTMYRLGSVFGHSKTGAGNLTDVVTRFIAGCVQVNAFPNVNKLEELLTVDDAATFLAEVGMQGAKVNGKTFHVWNGNLLAFYDLLRMVEEMYDVKINLIPLDEWAAKVHEQGSSNYFFALLGLVTEKLSSQCQCIWQLYAQAPEFKKDNCNIYSTLRMKPISKDILAKYIDYLKKHNIIKGF